MEHHFSHRLPAHEVARRQRWVAVGVTILIILILVLWIASLPARIGGAGNSFANFFSRTTKPAQYVSEDVLNTDTQDKEITDSLAALQQAIVTEKNTQAALTQPMTSSTIEAIKQKLK